MPPASSGLRSSALSGSTEPSWFRYRLVHALLYRGEHLAASFSAGSFSRVPIRCRTPPAGDARTDPTYPASLSSRRASPGSRSSSRHPRQGWARSAADREAARGGWRGQLCARQTGGTGAPRHRPGAARPLPPRHRGVLQHAGPLSLRSARIPRLTDPGLGSISCFEFLVVGTVYLRRVAVWSFPVTRALEGH